MLPSKAKIAPAPIDLLKPWRHSSVRFLAAPGSIQEKIRGYSFNSNGINHMIIPGWKMGVRFEKEDVEKDPEGIMTMKVLWQNMAWCKRGCLSNLNTDGQE